LFTQTETHYVFELLGSRRHHGPLLVKENSKISSFNRLVGGFDPDGTTIYMFGAETPEQINIHMSYEDITITSQLDIVQLEARFPGFASLNPGARLHSLVGSASFLPIDAQYIRTLSIKNCYLTSHAGNIIRPRYVNFLFGSSRETGEDELIKDFGEFLDIPSPQLMGISTVPERQEQSLRLAAEFASLYLQNVEETTLTQFLSKHGEMVKRAFNADKIFFEKPLKWIDGNPDPSETSIRPDIILRKHDGSWLVMDFKLPLLEKRHITTGRRARRRFIHSVSDGISQLFNYADYFSFAANQECVAAQLGEQVSDPQLVLIVGNYENFNLAEASEAKRPYKAIDIIDYDTLIRLYLADKSAQV
jgi:hypothetical protein